MELKRFAGRDRHGGRTYEAPVPLSVVVTWPRKTSETDTVYSGLGVVLRPNTTKPGPEDVVVYNGLDYQVAGEPGVWGYFDSPAGIEVALERIS